MCRRCFRAGASAAVERVRLCGFCVVNEHKCIATESIHVGAHNGEYARDSNRGVNGVASFAEHFYPSGGCERVIGRDGAGIARDHRATLCVKCDGCCHCWKEQ
jgi:hypothetical protein